MPGGKMIEPNSPLISDCPTLLSSKSYGASIAENILVVTTVAAGDHWIYQTQLAQPVSTLYEVDADVVSPILMPVEKLAFALKGRLAAIPWFFDNNLVRLELIDRDGASFCFGDSECLGAHWPAQEWGADKNKPLLLCVGVASALAVTGCGNYECYASHDMLSLPAVAREIATAHAGRTPTILAELVDSTGEVHERIIAVAREIGAKVAVPRFLGERPNGFVNFGHLCQVEAPELTDLLIMTAERIDDRLDAHDPKRVSNVVLVDYWPSLRPLATPVERVPYPLDALPTAIRCAVEEVTDFVKAPVALTACGAVSALALAGQAVANVKRAERLEGPTALFLLAVAESGERKTKVDNFFMQPIRDFEYAQAIAAGPAKTEYQQRAGALESRIAGVKEGIRGRAKAGKSSEDLEQVLLDLERSRKAPPRYPRLIYNNTSSEALLFELANRWPSGGVVSSEAGMVFGSHSLGGDSVMRSLAAFNQLWDGIDVNVDRRTSDSFVVRGARFSMTLQVQPETMSSFLEKSGALARGMGFLARFLMCYPESTQGTRPFTEAPKSWSSLDRFNERITEILQLPIPVRPDGGLAPAVLSMSQRARAAWIGYHDRIESELAEGGDYVDVRDVASKSAENAARLAALFQVFESGVDQEISESSFDSASRITAWHLDEAKRYLSENFSPGKERDAVVLEKWLICYAKKSGTSVVNKNDVRQKGPVNLRRGILLESAIDELESAGRVRLGSDGRRTVLELHPELLA